MARRFLFYETKFLDFVVLFPIQGFTALLVSSDTLFFTCPVFRRGNLNVLDEASPSIRIHKMM